MPVRIFFLDNEILIDTIPTPFVAGSLIARMNGQAVEIGRVESDFVFTSIPWENVAARDGTTFDTSDDAMAYVTAQLAMRRPVGETFGVATVAGASLLQGLPVAVSRATGQLLPARSDTYTLAFVAGLSSADTAQGFAVQPVHGAVTLTDWSAVAGSATLSSGLPYFLGATGGLTTSPLASPAVCVVRVGHAVSPTPLVVAPSDPITL